MAPALFQLISSSGLYGAERVLLELASFIRDQGWTSHVGALVSPGAGGVAVAEEARRRGLPTFLFPCDGPFDTRAVDLIRRHVQRNRIEVAHGHGYKADIFLWLGRLQRQGVKLVSTCHNWLTDSPKLMLYELADKLALSQFDRVVAVSTQLEQELAAAGIDPDRRALIENGLTFDPPGDPAHRQDLRRSLGVPPDAPLVLAVGRLDAWKGYDLLLDAFATVAAELPTAWLLIAGDGDLRDDLLARARRLGLGPRALLPGYREDVPALLDTADLFVISSSKEGLPMVLLEAMAAGLPVVSTAVGEIPRVLEDGVGMVVPPGDGRALAGAISRMLRDPDLRRQIGGIARERFLVQYSREAMGARYQRIYERLLMDRA